jgi:hypothetical protein
MHPDDLEYATQELTALYLSWLHSLKDPVLNRPTPQGLSGQMRHMSEWLFLASEAGLLVPHYRQNSYQMDGGFGTSGRVFPIGTPFRTVFIVSGHVVGVNVPPEIKEGCRRLARLVGTELLGIDFASSTISTWTFAGATPFPDLRLGGRELLDVLVSVLKGNQEGDI